MNVIDTSCHKVNMSAYIWQRLARAQYMVCKRSISSGIHNASFSRNAAAGADNNYESSPARVMSSDVRHVLMAKWQMIQPVSDSGVKELFHGNEAACVMLAMSYLYKLINEYLHPNKCGAGLRRSPE